MSFLLQLLKFFDTQAAWFHQIQKKAQTHKNNNVTNLVNKRFSVFQQVVAMIQRQYLVLLLLTVIYQVTQMIIRLGLEQQAILHLILVFLIMIVAVRMWYIIINMKIYTVVV